MYRNFSRNDPELPLCSAIFRGMARFVSKIGGDLSGNFHFVAELDTELSV